MNKIIQHKSYIFVLSCSLFTMESILTAYRSSSDDCASASSESEEECPTSTLLAKRKRSDEPHFVRAFPHVDGNWPSHVRLEFPVNPEFRELAKCTIDRAQKLVGDAITVVPFKELGLHKSISAGGNKYLHVSLSRPFVLCYNQINNFVDSLRAALKWRQRCESN